MENHGRARNATAGDASLLMLDPACGMKVAPAAAAGSHSFAGTTYYFCSAHCKTSFAANPQKYLGKPANGPATAAAKEIDPVCGMTVDPATAAGTHAWHGKAYYFCSTRCKTSFAPRRSPRNGPNEKAKSTRSA